MFAADRMSGDFQNLNRNKRSLTLNLKYPQGREILYKLVETADVVVENWRPDVKARLGLTTRRCAASTRASSWPAFGYGQSGLYARRPGFDQIIQGLSGLMSITGEPGGKPHARGLAVADVGAGMYAAMGILMAVIERQRSGQGQWVQASLLHSLIAMLDFQVARYPERGRCAGRGGQRPPDQFAHGPVPGQRRSVQPGLVGRGHLAAPVRASWAARTWSRCPNTAARVARAQPRHAQRRAGADLRAPRRAALGPGAERRGACRLVRSTRFRRSSPTNRCGT